MFQVTNVGNDEFVGRYRQQWIKVPAGATIVLEEGAVHAWLGNPTTKNTPAWKQREDEFNRIRFMWCGENMDTPGYWDSHKPMLTVVDLANGEPYFTVADDPEGTNLTTAELNADIEKESLIATMKQLEARLKALEAGGDPKVDDKPSGAKKVLPTDTPNKARITEQ